MVAHSALYEALYQGWQDHVDSKKSTKRYKEHTNPFQKFGEGSNAFDYRTLTLDQSLPAFQVIQDHYNDHRSHSWFINDMNTLTTLKYTVEIIGSPPTSGRRLPLYLALHGGGGPTPTAPQPETNDDEWKGMRDNYKGAVTSGVWLALRGFGDSWDLHFTSAAYVLMDQLIENMILFGATDAGNQTPVKVDSNQVYLVGFSAGGDGVYRLSNRLAQRFAAVNMGGGHPGSMVEENMTITGGSRLNCGLQNLMNTPICLQVGELDNPEHRAELTAQSGEDLEALKRRYRAKFNNPIADFYNYKVLIHPTGNDQNQSYLFKHNSWEQGNFNFKWDKFKTPPPQLPVISDIVAWKQGWVNTWPSKARDTKNESTNCIVDWFAGKSRNPIPPSVVWDLAMPKVNDNFDERVFSSLAEGQGRQNYWLDITGQQLSDVGPLIEARIDKEASNVIVYRAQKYLRVLLRPGMVSDMSKVWVQVQNQAQTKWQTLGPLSLTWNKNVISQTLVRNDPQLVFCSDIILTQADDGTWTVTTSTPASNSSKL